MGPKFFGVVLVTADLCAVRATTVSRARPLQAEVIGRWLSSSYHKAFRREAQEELLKPRSQYPL